MTAKRICPMLFSALIVLAAVSRSQGVDLLSRYPTTLSSGDTSPERARPWDFSEADVFRLSTFNLTVADLHIEVGTADLGIGHCRDGAVWAILLPRGSGALTSQQSSRPEAIAHVWMRFHPKQIARLFPSETVFSDGDRNVAARMRVIAAAKFASSWHAGMDAMIPQPNDLTIDVDTKDGPRRFFAIDRSIPKVQYISAFERGSLKPAPAFSSELAEQAFDKLWSAYDREYALFVLRPEVDWAALRERYRPEALAAKSAYEFAGVCAQMLKPLRDLHIWMHVAGGNVPVFNRPRSANANPRALEALLGQVSQAGPQLTWAVSADKTGYLLIHSWSGNDLPNQCHRALEEMRGTRGLIVDVRLNGGGSEDLAGEVAGRFVPKEFVYAFDQVRNGPGHGNLAEKSPRTVEPRGPWRYNRPVVLLIGQKCMSSNESFIAMMSGDPDLTTMGDHTCGSSGNPRMLNLPMDITVSLPRWIDYLPDGTPLDERGFQPQVLFQPKPGAFQGDRDDLLAAALDRLRHVPLPAKAIAGPRFSAE